MGQIDYALIVTIAVVLFLAIRRDFFLGGFQDLMIAVLFFSLPIIGFYHLLRVIFIALGFMRRI
jgi:hypothetical protein